MHWGTVVTAFATIFFAELPDKTMIATIVLSARFKRPFAVWLGSASALVVQVTIATVAGRLLDLLPDRPVHLVVAGMFAVGAVLLWRSSAADDAVEQEAEAEVARAELAAARDPSTRTMPWTRVSGTVFGIVFLAEWGDLTQIATASLASNGHAFSVFVGASLAMITVAGIGAAAGQALLRVLPERLLHRIAALIFGALAVVFAVAAW